MGATGTDETVLVLGATSLVGRFLLPRLAAAGTAAVALSRDPPVEAVSGVTWLRGDLTDPELPSRLPAARTVFSLMPIWLIPPLLPVLRARGVERLIAFSSTSRFTKQDSPAPSERAVARRLAAGETATMAACEKAGTAWTILRPTLIYAEGRDGNVTRLARLIARFGVLPLAGRGEGLRQPVHADDLAAGALAAADASAARDRAYDLPGGETLAYRDMAARIFEALGKPPRMVAVPPALWKLGLELAGPLLPGATAAMGARMAEDLIFDGGPAARDFGWSPRGFRPDFRGVKL
ncbi:MAG TPA: NAD-dependent epimerase/dehydratase family protein [Caulobacteraceae bacterium]|nr:NAD-dependent epimerase/dehydratase family protein [Caulobacteraceae bacterium]